MNHSPGTVFIFPFGIGDGVMATAVAAAYYERFHQKMHIGHKNPELFENNPYVICHPDFSEKALLEDENRCLRLAEEKDLQLIALSYLDFVADANHVTNYLLHKSNWIARLGEKAGLSGSIECRPRIYLTQGELQYGKLFGDNQIAVMSQGIEKSKSWPVDRLQKVIAAYPQLNFVQVGAPNDVPLAGVTNLCGKISLRQVACVFAHSRLFVGTEGALMHIARAVECPAVILSPDKEHPGQMLYPEFTNICSEKPCTNCDKGINNINVCEISEHCIDRIDEKTVIAAMERELAKPREVLPAVVANMEPEPATALEEFENQYKKFRTGYMLIDSSNGAESQRHYVRFVLNEKGGIAQYRPKRPETIKNLRISGSRKYDYFYCVDQVRIENFASSGELKTVKVLECDLRHSWSLKYDYRGKRFLFPRGTFLNLSRGCLPLQLNAGEVLTVDISSVHHTKIQEVYCKNLLKKVIWNARRQCQPISFFLSRCINYFLRKLGRG